MAENFGSKKVENENCCEENDENRSTLSFRTKLGYSFGHVFNDLVATVWFSYTLLFFKDVLLMPHEAGYYMMLGQVTDAFFSAIVGYLTDHFSTKRTWHIMGTIIVAISFPTIFMLQRDVLPYWGNLFFFSVFITLFQCGWATVQISHLAILPELATTQTDRSELNSMRYCLSIFSNITVFMVAWIVLHIENRNLDLIGTNDFDKFRNITSFLTAAGILASVIFLFSLSYSKYDETRKDKKLTQDVNNRSTNITSSSELYKVFKNVELYKVAMLYTFSRLFLVICIIYIPIWLNEFMKSQESDVQSIENIAIIPLIFFVASFFAAFLLKYINQHVSHKITYCAGSLISILGCIWIAISNSLIKANELFGVAVLLGCGSSITQISSLCITADLIGDNSKHSGLIYSIITVCDKLFSGIIIFLIESLENNGHYTDVLIFNGIAALLGLVVLGTFRSKL